MDKFGFDDNTIAALGALCARGRLSHAVLLCGADAALRAKAALHLAAYTVCTAADGKPCGSCPACKKAFSGTHPDINIVEKPEKKKQFAKEDIRSLCAQVYITPAEAQIKVYIISEMQDMTVESQNLLLKILEEPPEYASFVLTASSKNVLLPTVRSRVTPLELGEGSGRREYNPEAVKHAAASARALTETGEFAMLAALAPLEDKKELLSDSLYVLMLTVRDAFTEKAGGDTLLSGLPEEAELLAGTFTLSRLTRLFDAVNSLLADADANQNKTLLITRAASSLRRAVR